MAPEQSPIPGDQEPRIGFVSAAHAPGDLPPRARRLPDLAASNDCDLVVVNQNWPDEFTQSAAESLLAGGARVICCCGPWCESDGRTRSIWPHSVRTPRSAWRDALSRELEILAGHRPAPPLTAARDELFLAAQPDDVQLDCAVMVDSPDRVLRDVIRARLAKAGCALGEERETVAVVDADPWNLETRDRLMCWKESQSVDRVIALTGFRRDAEVADMLAAGADAVVDKLDLERQLLRTLANSRDATT